MNLLKDKVLVPGELLKGTATLTALNTSRIDALIALFEAATLPVFLLSKTKYTFKPQVILDAIAAFIKADGGVNLTVGDLQELDAFSKVKNNEDDHAMIPSIYAMVDYDDLELFYPVEDILAGLTIVIGKRGSGKTTYLNDELGVDILIRLNEPMEHIDNGNAVYQATSVTNAVTVAILLSLLGQKVAIDSFKSLVYGIEGAAMTGGMSSGVFDFMTTMNNLIANFGVHIVATVNPMDPNKVDNVFDMLAASVTGTVLISDYKVQTSTYRLSSGRVINKGSFDLLDDQLDSRDKTGPFQNTQLPEQIEVIGALPRAFVSSDDYKDEKPRKGGKVLL